MSDYSEDPVVATDDTDDEYERRRVPESKTRGFGSFLALFASEHVAGTELLIGPLFLVHGVSAFDLLVGLFIGNLLAVLSWTLLTAPIAVQYRITHHFQLEKIGGSQLVQIYNLANGVLWCFIAAAMISVSASAVGVPLHVPMPALSDTLPNSGSMVLVVFGVGGVMTLIATKGIAGITRFANFVAPWIVIGFIVLGVVALNRLHIHSWAEFWQTATSSIWPGRNQPGYVKFTFWHVLFFAWFGNMAWHIGMGDLSFFRYAKKAYYGLTSAAGMFLGHYVAWIAAALLYAVQLQQNPANTVVAPGPMANDAGGFPAVLLVLVAGWATGNPLIYRAGLAFQSLRPSWSRTRLTLISGALSTVVAIFPALSMKFLSVAALYGLILMPMGAVIFVDHYLIARLGMQSFWAEKARIRFNAAPAVAWVLSLALCWGLNSWLGIEVFFLGLPGWFLAAILYVIVSKVVQQPVKQSYPVQAD